MLEKTFEQVLCILVVLFGLWLVFIAGAFLLSVSACRWAEWRQTRNQERCRGASAPKL